MSDMRCPRCGGGTSIADVTEMNRAIRAGLAAGGTPPATDDARVRRVTRLAGGSRD